jgi:hypothetical protein
MGVLIHDPAGMAGGAGGLTKRSGLGAVGGAQHPGLDAPTGGITAWACRQHPVAGPLAVKLIGFRDRRGGTGYYLCLRMIPSLSMRACRPVDGS